MTKDEMLDQLKDAAKQYSSGTKVATRPETQFKKGALWLWDLLMATHGRIYFEERLRADLMDREGKVDKWKESLIYELADMLAEREEMQATIAKEGRLLTKHDKQEHPYKESNPLYVHVKAKEQSISVWRDKLGLSNTVNVDRIRQSAKNDLDESSPMGRFYEAAAGK